MQRTDTDIQARLIGLAEKFSGRRVVVIGDVIADEYMYGKLSRLSREAPVPILNYDGTMIVPGGAGNAASNVSALGGDGALVGIVGHGEVDRRLFRALRAKIDTTSLLRPTAYRAPIKTRILAGGQHSIRQQIVRVDREASSIDEAVSRQFVRKAIASLAEADAVIVSDYGSGLVTPALVVRLKSKLDRRRRRRSVPILIDSRYKLDQFLDCTACTPNQSEVEAILRTSIGDDCRRLEQAGRALLKKTRVGGLVVTRGSQGMAVFERGRRTDHIPIYGTDEVADVTGAGDTVIAALTLALSSGGSLYEAACLANYAGGLVVKKRGTATVGRDELIAAIRADRDHEERR